MANIILNHGFVCDGYDAKVQLEDGSTMTLHFADGMPEDLQLSVDDIISSIPVEPVLPDYVVLGEV